MQGGFHFLQYRFDDEPASGGEDDGLTRRVRCHWRKITKAAMNAPRIWKMIYLDKHTIQPVCPYDWQILNLNIPDSFLLREPFEDHKADSHRGIKVTTRRSRTCL